VSFTEWDMKTQKETKMSYTLGTHPPAVRPFGG